MNELERYSKRYLRWHSTYEKRATKELQKVFKGWAGELKLYGQPNQWMHQIDSQFEDEDIFKAYVTIYKYIGIKHGMRIGRIANIENKDFDPILFNETYEQYVAMYLQQHGLARIFDVRSTFVKWLAEIAVKKGIDNPDPSTVATWIQQASRGRMFYRWQALRIARTETTAAANLGSLNAVRDSGYVMDKIWVSAQDERTRKKPGDWFDHYEMNGKKVGMGGKFEMVSKMGQVDNLEYPGEPSGHPANIINCRCTLIYKPRKVDGRLVRQ